MTKFWVLNPTQVLMDKTHQKNIFFSAKSHYKQECAAQHDVKLQSSWQFCSICMKSVEKETKEKRKKCRESNHILKP